MLDSVGFGIHQIRATSNGLVYLCMFILFSLLVGCIAQLEECRSLAGELTLSCAG